MRKHLSIISIALILFGALSIYVYANKPDKKAAPPDNESIPAHLRLGLDYYKTKQLDNALDEFAKTVSIKKNSPMAYYFMGLIYEEKAVIETNAQKAKEIKRKALDAWQNYLGCDHSNAMKSKSHRTNGISIKESIKRAKKHVEMLQEDLRNE